MGNIESPQLMADTIMKGTSQEEYQEVMLDFVNLSTVSERLRGKKCLSCEFVGQFHGWT